MYYQFENIKKSAYLYIYNVSHSVSYLKKLQPILTERGLFGHYCIIQIRVLERTNSMLAYGGLPFILGAAAHQDEF